MSSDIPSHFSALLEIVGLRDLAEEEPTAFEATSNAFRNLLDVWMFQHKTTCTGRLWIDSCYLQTADCRTLVQTLAELRDQLLSSSQPVFLRAGVIAEPFLNSKQHFSRGAAILKGKIIRLKAAAIDIDPDAVQHLKSNEREKLIFSNYYLTGVRRLHFTNFLDVRCNPTQAICQKLGFPRIFRQIGRSLQRSGKSARFYVSLLVNFAKNLQGEALELFLHSLEEDTENYELLRKIPEGELVLLSLIDRFLTLKEKSESSQFTTQEEKTWNALSGVITKWTQHSRGWIIERISKDNNNGPVPDLVISPQHRGAWRSLVQGAKEARVRMLNQQKQSAKNTTKASRSAPKG